MMLVTTTLRIRSHISVRTRLVPHVAGEPLQWEVGLGGPLGV